MKTDELLDHLSGPGSGDVEALVKAARARADRRRMVRETGAAAAVLACAVAGLVLLVKPSPAPKPEVAGQKPVPVLTGDELLDSFGDQPVALITYPDGSQRLLAIVRP